MVFPEKYRLGYEASLVWPTECRLAYEAFLVLPTEYRLAHEASIYFTKAYQAQIYLIVNSYLGKVANVSEKHFMTVQKVTFPQFSLCLIKSRERLPLRIRHTDDLVPLRIFDCDSGGTRQTFYLDTGGGGGGRYFLHNIFKIIYLKKKIF
jgi:hypothetical protein